MYGTINSGISKGIWCGLIYLARLFAAARWAAARIRLGQVLDANILESVVGSGPGKPACRDSSRIWRSNLASARRWLIIR